MGDFDVSWQKFVSHGRLECGGHTDPNFRGVHTLSASFIIPVTNPETVSNLSHIRDALRPFPFVTLHPDHFLHISVAFAGFVSEDDVEGKEENSISREELHGIATSARDVLGGMSPFEVELSNLNAFPSVAYVEIHEGGDRISDMAKLVGEACDIEAKFGQPHMTVAYFRAPDGTRVPAEFVRAIESFRRHPIGTVEVDRVELTILPLEEEYPRLEVVEEFRLWGIS